MKDVYIVGCGAHGLSASTITEKQIKDIIVVDPPKTVLKKYTVEQYFDIVAPLTIKTIKTKKKNNRKGHKRKKARNGIDPWLDKMATHGNGIALTPDRTSTEWWQKAANNSGAHLQVFGKIQFINEDGQKGKSPSTGTTLFAYGDKAIRAILNAQKNGLGSVYRKLI